MKGKLIMKKNDIIAVYAEKKDVTKKEATEVVGSVIDIIKNGIKEDGLVDIAGFVKLQKVYKEARTGKNPRTGEAIQIAASKVPAFKAGKALKDVVNN